MVQWLGLGAFTARARVRSLVRELRSCKPRCAAIKKKGERDLLESFSTPVVRCHWSSIHWAASSEALR